jgi:hypothetical protein
MSYLNKCAPVTGALKASFADFYSPETGYYSIVYTPPFTFLLTILYLPPIFLLTVLRITGKHTLTLSSTLLNLNRSFQNLSRGYQ